MCAVRDCCNKVLKYGILTMKMASFGARCILVLKRVFILQQTRNLLHTCISRVRCTYAFSWSCVTKCVYHAVINDYFGLPSSSDR